MPLFVDKLGPQIRELFLRRYAPNAHVPLLGDVANVEVPRRHGFSTRAAGFDFKLHIVSKCCRCGTGRT